MMGMSEMAYSVGEKVLIAVHRPGLKGKEGTVLRAVKTWNYIVEIDGTEYEFGEAALRRVAVDDHRNQTGNTSA